MERKHRIRIFPFKDEVELVTQAFRNVGDTFKGNTRVLLHAIAKEIERLRRTKEEEDIREENRRWRENAKAQKAGADLPYPDDDIPF